MEPSTFYSMKYFSLDLYDIVMDNLTVSIDKYRLQIMFESVKRRKKK